MKGRKENEERVFNKINELMNITPSYMRDYYSTLSEKSYTTQWVYINHVLDFAGFLESEYDIDIKDIESFKKVKPSTINAYVSSLGEIGNSYKAGKLYAIKSFFKYLYNDDYILNNPCDKVEIPKDNEEHRITALTKDEIDIIKNNIFNGIGSDIAIKKQQRWRKRDYAIMMLALSLGLRVTSLSEINIEDVDFENNGIKIVEKGNNIRTVSFSERIKQVLEDWLTDRERILEKEKVESDALFISNRLTRISTRGITVMVKKYTHNIDKHITPHKLRSTCGTNVYNATGDIYLTAEILGHSDIRNTRRYAAISDERKKKAAKAMDDILF